MTALDPALCARLVSEAREHTAAAMEPHPPGLDSAASRAVMLRRLGGINGLIDRHSDLADQLEAALAEVERLRAALTSRVMP